MRLLQTRCNLRNYSALFVCSLRLEFSAVSLIFPNRRLVIARRHTLLRRSEEVSRRLAAFTAGLAVEHSEMPVLAPKFVVSFIAVARIHICMRIARVFTFSRGFHVPYFRFGSAGETRRVMR